MPTLLALDRVLTRRKTERFGRYELLGRLGAGGMAEVFVARCGDVAGMQSLLALKRILPHLAEDESFVALFRREAQICLRLHHRAIARVVEVGRVGSAWFLAMELVPGESLAQVLRAEPERGIAADPRLVAWVGAEIATALHHAHALTDGGASLRVIHRDVSPQNLLLGFDGATKLIDFGVARCAMLSDATRAGTVRGKLAYASPEQLGARSLDGRSDLFSLAVVLHEWIAGAPLFARESDAATVHAVAAAPIPPLPRAPRLGAVLARALERAPERRFASGEQLAEALLDAVGGRPATPERLVAAHLGELFPDRRLRWQAIVAGGDVDVAALAAVTPRAGEPMPGAGATVRGTGSVSASTARTGVRRQRQWQRRWRWRPQTVLALAAATVFATLFINWSRRDHLVVSPAPGLTFAEARPMSPGPARAVAPPGASSVSPSKADARPGAASVVTITASRSRSRSRSRLSARSAERSGPAPESRHPRGRLSAGPFASARPRIPAPVAPSPATAAPTATAVPGERRGVVDELEPSPYTTP